MGSSAHLNQYSLDLPVLMIKVDTSRKTQRGTITSSVSSAESKHRDVAERTADLLRLALHATVSFIVSKCD